MSVPPVARETDQPSPVASGEVAGEDDVEVDALTTAIRRGALNVRGQDESRHEAQARAVLTSPWLADHDAKVAAAARAEGGDDGEVESLYDSKAIRDVIDDYVLIRGDLSEEYAREQLATIVERRLRAARAEGAREALEGAADEVHLERRYQQEMVYRNNGDRLPRSYTVERLGVVERILRARAAEVAP